MTATVEQELRQALPNLRLVYPRPTCPQSDENLKGILFRSSRTDLLSENHSEMLRDSGIKTIVDMRPVRNYLQTDGDKYVDKFYALYKPKLSHTKEKLGTDESVHLVTVKSKTHEHLSSFDGKLWHICLNLYNLLYLWHILWKAPLGLLFMALFHLAVDMICLRKRFLHSLAGRLIGHHTQIDHYKYLIDFSKPAIAAALKILSDRRHLPAMIVCTHGKDRTGIVTALVLSVLGSTREEIVQDYAESAENLECIKDRLYYEIRVRGNMREEYMDSKPETMRMLLDYVDEKYGSMDAYLDDIGFGAMERRRLRDNLGGQSE